MPRRLLAEALGSALLFATVVGSGIMGVRLAAGNDAVALLANALATGAMLYVLITVLGPISGAHFNPAVTMVMAWRGQIPRVLAVGYALAQVGGGVGGVLAAHAMFGLPLWEVSHHDRSSWGLAGSEALATFGLVLVIVGGMRHRPAGVSGLVAAYIVAAYWFTASTSFANPAITVARALSDTFAGIAPASVPGFIAAQLIGAAGGHWVGRALFDA